MKHIDFQSWLSGLQQLTHKQRTTLENSLHGFVQIRTPTAHLFSSRLRTLLISTAQHNLNFAHYGDLSF
jgi:hypothetical protein